MATFEERLSASRVRLRARFPFFGALLLFARVIPTDAVPLAATDGRDLFVNPEAVAPLRSAEFDGLLLHEVLHAALLHVDRRKLRDPVRWNIAADIVVNGIIAELPNIALPAGGLRDATLEKLPVEEVYEKLQGTTIKLALADLLEGDGAGSDEAATTLGVEQRAAQWREALGQAETLSRMGIGKLPAGLVRAMGEVLAPTLDWRAMLWRFVTVTPSDFADYDRRFIYRGLYLDALVGESLHVAVAVDTSGSVSPRQLEGFLAELAGILSAYPHVSAWLYYIDTAIAGPYAVHDMAAVPAPRGGGGTSFEPFFAHVESTRGEVQRVLVYLTDGYGTFPKERPAEPVLWVVTAGGLASEQFPFGEVARLRES